MTHATSWILFTTICFTLITVTWYRLKSVPILLGLLLAFYFSLFGSAFIILESLGFSTGMRLPNLSSKLIYPQLDDEYWLTMFGYFLFFSAAVAGVHSVTNRTEQSNGESPPVFLNFFKLGVFALTLQGISLFLIKDHLVEIAVGNAAGYLKFTTLNSDWRYSLSMALREVGLATAFAGAGAFFAGSKKQLKNMKLASGLVIGLNIVLAAGVSIFMGDKHELLSAILAGIVGFSLAGGRLSFAPIALMTALGFSIFALIDGTRGEGILDSQKDLWESFTIGAFDVLTSNEAFAAHFSLYGILKLDLPIQWGHGFWDLIVSIPPQFFGLPRTEGVYQVYSEGIFAKQGQGFTIHHAAAWYLNIGWLGPLVGGFIMGLVWGKANQIARDPKISLSKAGSTLALALSVTALAYAPSLMRAPIETYKGFSAFLLGSFVIFYLSSSWRESS